MVSFSGIANGVIAAGQIAQIVLPFLSSRQTRSTNTSAAAVCGPVSFTQDSTTGIITATNTNATEVPTAAQLQVGSSANNYSLIIPPNQSAELPSVLSDMNPDDCFVCYNAGADQPPSEEELELGGIFGITPKLSLWYGNTFSVNTPITIQANINVNVTASLGIAGLTIVGVAAIAAYTKIQLARIKYSNGSTQVVQNIIAVSTQNTSDTDQTSSSTTLKWNLGPIPSYTGDLEIDSIDICLEGDPSDSRAYEFRDHLNEAFLTNGGTLRMSTADELKLINSK